VFLALLVDYEAAQAAVGDTRRVLRDVALALQEIARGKPPGMKIERMNASSSAEKVARARRYDSNTSNGVGVGTMSPRGSRPILAQEAAGSLVLL